MNWGRITKHAAALLVAQIAIGFVEGSFAPARATVGIVLLLASSAVSLLVCGSIFAHLAVHQLSKPFAHAWVTLFLQAVVALALWQSLSGWLGNVPLPSLALEWLTVICALLVGTSLGSSRRRSTGQPVDA